MKKDAKMPMFTSCCPGWVRFMKSQFPDYVDNLSTAKSPQQMFGAIAKTYYADILGVTPDKITCVSIMPCTAKSMNVQCHRSMTVEQIGMSMFRLQREFIRMLRAAQVNIDTLEEDAFDEPLGIGTGAGVIFGATGGVMEAALRSAYYFVTGKNRGQMIFLLYVEKMAFGK